MQSGIQCSPMWRWLRSLWSNPRRRAMGFVAIFTGYCAYAVLLKVNASSYRPLCPWLLITGWDCPFCGFTRAVGQLLCCDITGSWQMSPLALPVLGWMMSCIGVLLRRAFSSPCHRHDP